MTLMNSFGLYFQLKWLALRNSWYDEMVEARQRWEAEAERWGASLEERAAERQRWEAEADRGRLAFDPPRLAEKARYTGTNFGPGFWQAGPGFWQAIRTVNRG